MSSAPIHPAALPCWTSFDQLPRAYGDPLGHGALRSQTADFQVEELLGFDPDDAGDHCLLWVRKEGANSEWVMRRLARLVGTHPRNLGCAGLKDRHAVTWQWFSVPRPRGDLPDWSCLEADGIQVLEVRAHRRKLRRGALAGNRFRILVRGVRVASQPLADRLDRLRGRGVPNYFGPQRFGIAESNLQSAHALFSGATQAVSSHQRGLWLSAARAQIFNEVLADRVARGVWDQPLAGDCLQLAGCRSHFVPPALDDALRARVERCDLHPTAPLWGSGELPTGDPVREQESAIAAGFAPWCAGLVAAGLQQERRATRLVVDALSGQLVPEGVVLHFTLAAGAYATSVLRELLTWSEPQGAAEASD